MKKVTIADVQAFDNESFLEHYSTLIDVAMTSGREDAVMGTLSFINDLKRLINDLKADMAEETGECQVCSEKDLHINDLKGINKNQSGIIKELRRQIEALEKANGLQHQIITEKEKMKVCK